MKHSPIERWYDFMTGCTKNTVNHPHKCVSRPCPPVDCALALRSAGAAASPPSLKPSIIALSAISTTCDFWRAPTVLSTVLVLLMCDRI